jgi:hypothetical protein
LNGFRESLDTPTKIAALRDSAFVACSTTHSVTVNSTFEFFAFGLNEHGELGNGVAGVQALVKVAIEAGHSVIQAACGNSFSLALLRGKPPPQGVCVGGEPQDVKPDRKERLFGVDATGQFASGVAPGEVDMTVTQSQIASMVAQGVSTGQSRTELEASVKINQLMASFNLLGVEKTAATKPMVTEPALEAAPVSQTTSTLSALQALAQTNPNILAANPALAALMKSMGTVPASTAAPTLVSPASAVVQPESQPEDKKKKKKDLPPGWSKHLDEESGHHYYVNDATGETQWNRPGKE